MFQSTLPRRSDGALSTFVIGLLRFNPRSREGATVQLMGIGARLDVSIHAPAKERRHTLYHKQDKCHLFQSTLPRRSDRCDEWPFRWFKTFQSTLPRRSDDI